MTFGVCLEKSNPCPNRWVVVWHYQLPSLDMPYGWFIIAYESIRSDRLTQSRHQISNIKLETKNQKLKTATR